MVTKTIYSDSQIVVVDIGSVPATASWLEQTTYLIDQSGYTTAVLAQTNQPTSGVTLAPVPYTAQAPIALPSMTADDLPVGWAYKGCYIDYSEARLLPIEQPANSNLTIQSCVRSCSQIGYSVSGLEFRQQCFCGNAIYNGGTLAPFDSDCNLPCSGNHAQYCGATNRISVYSNGTLTTYQPAAVQTPRSTTTAPTIAPSPIGATSQTSKPAVTVAAAVVGVVAGIAITVALVYYFRWWIRRNRLRTEFLLPTPQRTAQPWPPADGVPSWEEFVKDTEEYYARITESTMLSSKGDGSGLGLKNIPAGYRPSIQELWKIYEQLRRKNQESFRVGLGSTDTSFASPASCSPPPEAPARAHRGQPTSILKRPAVTGTANMAHGMFDNEDEHGPRAVPATRNLALAKKGVRFGVNQIREFGRSPFIGHGSDT